MGMRRVAQLIFEFGGKAPKSEISVHRLELTADAAQVVAGEICVDRYAEAVGDGLD